MPVGVLGEHTFQVGACRRHGERVAVERSHLLVGAVRDQVHQLRRCPDRSAGQSRRHGLGQADDVRGDAEALGRPRRGRPSEPVFTSSKVSRRRACAAAPSGRPGSPAGGGTTPMFIMIGSTIMPAMSPLCVSSARSTAARSPNGTTTVELRSSDPECPRRCRPSVGLLERARCLQAGVDRDLQPSRGGRGSCPRS